MNYTIKITGSGTSEEITHALKQIVSNIEAGSHVSEMATVNWEDATLMTTISEGEQAKLDAIYDAMNDLLSEDSQEDFPAILKACVDTPNKDSLLDYVEFTDSTGEVRDVCVWATVEFRFTVKEFLKHIGYQK
jgi:exonuclease VII small subunit